MKALHVTPGKPDRLTSIDALRGIAALYVLVYHLALIPNPALQVPKWVAKYVLTGGTGVALFFVVSAFCLCLSMRMHEGEASTTVRFYVRRVFRIVPLFYFWVVVSLIRDRFWYGVAHSPFEVLLNMVFGFNFVPGKHEGFVWASWTLGVEMVFYLVFPLIYRYFGNWWKSLVFLGLAVAMSVCYSFAVAFFPLEESIRASYLRTSLLRQLPIFAFGIVAFFFYERFVKGKLSSVLWAFVATAAAVLCYDSLISGRLPAAVGDFYIQGFIYGVLLLGLTIAPVGALVNRATQFYGEISYSVYLSHPVVVAALVPVYRTLYSLQLPVTVKYGSALVVTLACVTILSYLTFLLIEKPGMRAGRRVVNMIGIQKEVSGAQAFMACGPTKERAG